MLKPANFGNWVDSLGCDGSAFLYRAGGLPVFAVGDPWIQHLHPYVGFLFDICIAYNHASGSRTGISTSSTGEHVVFHSGEVNISFHSMLLANAAKSAKVYVTNYPPISV